jgi:hypothetical protein
MEPHEEVRQLRARAAELLAELARLEQEAARMRREHDYLRAAMSIPDGSTTQPLADGRIP